ncbi:MAG TPA: cation diffusion facilitator family transporter [Rickettsiales bacterium]|nr:cation diffusion facilitator family transporter [Rickettsiales bacterium]
MADHHHSAYAIIVSLAADCVIAIIKFAAAFFTNSSALLAEAIHSALDAGNEVILLYGRHIAVQRSPLYPLGRDREQFFWSFIVSLLLFSAGGVFNLYQGIEKWAHGKPLEYPAIGVIVIVLSLIAEIYALRACFKQVDRKNPYGSLWEWIRYTANADLLVVTLTNVAAIFGLIVALVTLITNWITEDPRWDAAGSLIIGLLLIVAALLLARELKSLLIGEATRFDYKQALTKIMESIVPGMRILQFIALRRGLNKVFLAYKLHPGPYQRTQDAIDMTNRLEDEVRAKFPEVAWQFVELDTRSKPD